MILENIQQHTSRRGKYSSLDSDHIQKYPAPISLNLKAKTLEKNVHLRISRPQKQRISSENSCPSQDFPVKIVEKKNNRPRENLKQKLRLVPQTYSNYKTQSNSRQSVFAQSPTYNIILEQLIPTLKQNRLATTIQPDSLCLSIPFLTLLLEKAAISYQAPGTSHSHPFDCLHEILNKIGQATEKQRIEGKKAKNKISHVIMDKVSTDYRLLDIPKLKVQKNKLTIEIDSLEILQTKLTEALAEKRKHNDQLGSSISDKLRNLPALQEQSHNLQVQIQRYTQMLRQSRQHFQEITHFVDNQAKNKLVRIASRQYKEIESDLYEYAVYLQANELATSKDYQSIPLMNQIYSIEKLEQQLKGFNRILVQDETMAIECKSRMMRDFLIRYSTQFKRKDQQQQKLLEFKTNCIKKFVSMMKRWLDNWTLKQEYLVSLREEFSANAPVCLAKLANLERGCERCKGCNEQLKGIHQSVQKLVQNYKLGNSFY